MKMVKQLSDHLININLFGGPGTGKSTTAAELFVALKTADIKIELVHEYAKDLTYAEDSFKLQDQLHMLAEQHHRLLRLKGKVDVAIHDSPFIMGLAYNTDALIPQKELADLALALHNRYTHINIFLQRDIRLYPYQDYGRNESLEEALVKDKEILELLEKNNLPYTTIKMSNTTVTDILKLL